MGERRGNNRGVFGEGWTGGVKVNEGRKSRWKWKEMGIPSGVPFSGLPASPLLGLDSEIV